MTRRGVFKYDDIEIYIVNTRGSPVGVPLLSLLYQTHKKMKLKTASRTKAYTLIEMLVVVAIIATLAAIAFPAYAKMKERAEMAKNLANMRQFTQATLRWAADHSQTLPSPEYPGGHSSNFTPPEHWDFAGTGSGLWLDGIVYYATYFEEENNRRSERGEDLVEEIGGDNSNGEHLKDTFFASLQSFKKDPDEQDWHRHSYAMNSELQYDFLYKSSSRPELTEKNMARLIFAPNALLYIENQDSNVIGFRDLQDIIDTAEMRWSTNKVLATFLDGHAANMPVMDIPDKDPYSDRESSRFWRGVAVDTYTGE